MGARVRIGVRPRCWDIFFDFTPFFLAGTSPFDALPLVAFLEDSFDGSGLDLGLFGLADLFLDLEFASSFRARIAANLSSFFLAVSISAISSFFSLSAFLLISSIFLRASFLAFSASFSALASSFSSSSSFVKRLAYFVGLFVGLFVLVPGEMRSGSSPVRIRRTTSNPLRMLLFFMSTISTSLDSSDGSSDQSTRRSTPRR